MLAVIDERIILVVFFNFLSSLSLRFCSISTALHLVSNAIDTRHGHISVIIRGINVYTSIVVATLPSRGTSKFATRSRPLKGCSCSCDSCQPLSLRSLSGVQSSKTILLLSHTSEVDHFVFRILKVNVEDNIWTFGGRVFARLAK